MNNTSLSLSNVFLRTQKHQFVPSLKEI